MDSLLRGKIQGHRYLSIFTDNTMHRVHERSCLLLWLSLFIMAFLYFSCMISIDHAYATKLKRNAYEVLGISHDASGADISRAYRRLVRKLHPDTHPEKKEEFIEVARAYELLKDDESRERYDKYGDVEPDANRPHDGFYNGNFQQTFRVYQGGFPGFTENFEWGFPGGFHFVFPEESEFGQRKAAHDLYTGSIVVEIDQLLFKNFLRRKDSMVLVNFYSPRCHHCQSMTQEYIKLAKRLEKTVVVGAVNCGRHQALCSHQSVTQYPSIFLFVPPTGMNKIQYTGPRKAKAMEQWVWTASPFIGTVLTNYNFDSWLDSATHKPKVIYFSSNGTVPIILKALAAEYNSSISIGSISKFERLLSKRFSKISLLPAMLHVENMDTLEGEWLDVGALTRQRISLWLSRIVAANRQEVGRYGGFTSYKELTSRRYGNGECAINDNRFCFILFKCGNPMETEIDQILATVSKKYKRDPVKFVWIDTRKQASVGESFGIGRKYVKQNNCIHFVAFRPKRQIYKELFDDLRQPGNVDNFVEIVLSGSVIFTDRLKKPISFHGEATSKISTEEL